MLNRLRMEVCENKVLTMPGYLAMNLLWFLCDGNVIYKRFKTKIATYILPKAALK